MIIDLCALMLAPHDKAAPAANAYATSKCVF
jgi:hypothetical protein